MGYRVLEIKCNISQTKTRGWDEEGNVIAWLIIDGYNLILRCGAPPGMPASDLEGRRHQWVVLLEKLLGIMAERITLVFDGQAKPVQSGETGPVEVIFSSAGQTADSVIERLAFGARPGEVTVVSSDRLEIQTASASGAVGMSCSVFYEKVCETISRLSSTQGASPRTAKQAPPLGNPFANLRLPLD